MEIHNGRPIPGFLEWPMEWIEITLEELESTPRLRWLDCPRYEKCLDIANDRNQEGWTCLYCPFQNEHRKEKEHE